jgi:hypothetical protein
MSKKLIFCFRANDKGVTFRRSRVFVGSDGRWCRSAMAIGASGYCAAIIGTRSSGSCFVRSARNKLQHNSIRQR